MYTNIVQSYSPISCIPHHCSLSNAHLLTPSHTPHTPTPHTHPTHPTYTYTLPQLVDYRVEFSKWWVTEFKHIKFPSQGTIFDYYLDHETRKWMPWSEKVPKFTLDPEIPLQVCIDNA